MQRSRSHGWKPSQFQWDGWGHWSDIFSGYLQTWNWTQEIKLTNHWDQESPVYKHWFQKWLVAIGLKPLIRLKKNVRRTEVSLGVNGLKETQLSHGSSHGAPLSVCYDLIPSTRMEIYTGIHFLVNFPHLVFSGYFHITDMHSKTSDDIVNFKNRRLPSLFVQQKFYRKCSIKLLLILLHVLVPCR